jgi:hypothetical protein
VDEREEAKQWLYSNFKGWEPDWAATWPFENQGFQWPLDAEMAETPIEPRIFACSMTHRLKCHSRTYSMRIGRADHLAHLINRHYADFVTQALAAAVFKTALTITTRT